MLELSRDINDDGKIDKYDIIKKPLKQNGDFRSDEAVELLKEADIVVSNPPFSCFSDYIEQLVKYNKKFLILGPLNAISYKDVYSLIKDNKLWFGYGFNASVTFQVPDHYESKLIENGKKMAKLGGITWYTNLPNNKRNEELILYKKYTPEEYPKYDNYDAINVDKVRDIPMDYDGVMGVPITFLGSYNPNQFELLNANDYRINDTPIKDTQLIKDASASIKKGGGKNNLCTNLYQTYCSLPELTVGMSTDNANMQGYSSVSYLDMVARPIVQGIKLYRRVFIKKIIKQTNK